MSKPKTSVVFVNTSDKKIRTIQIPTIIVQKWKYYFFSISIGFIFMIGLLTMFINKKAHMLSLIHI